MQDNQIHSDVRWQWLKMEEMSPAQLYALLAFRESIFVVEQVCAYQELDGRDQQAWHLLGVHAGHVVACLRVLLPPDGDSPGSRRYRIGRVAVGETERGKGLARQMIGLAEQKINQLQPHAEIVLDAQSYLLPFYQALGYMIKGEEFLEDGIPHRPMSKQLEQ